MDTVCYHPELILMFTTSFSSSEGHVWITQLICNIVKNINNIMKTGGKSIYMKSNAGLEGAYWGAGWGGVPNSVFNKQFRAYS